MNARDRSLLSYVTDSLTECIERADGRGDGALSRRLRRLREGVLDLAIGPGKRRRWWLPWR